MSTNLADVSIRIMRGVVNVTIDESPPITHAIECNTKFVVNITESNRPAIITYNDKYKTFRRPKLQRNKERNKFNDIQIISVA